MPPERIELSLLHGFSLAVDGREQRLPLSAQRVIAYLALRQRPANRLLVSGTLWADLTEARAAGALRTALWRAQAAAGSIVAVRGPGLCLRDEVDVDVRAFDALARTVVHDPTAGAPEQPGLLLSAGELLPDWFDDWVLLERERLRQLRLQALESFARANLAAGHHGIAIDAASTAMAAEPLRESAHRILLEIHLDQGNHVEARRQYRLCHRLLLDKLGLEPSPAMQALLARVAGERA